MVKVCDVRTRAHAHPCSWEQGSCQGSPQFPAAGRASWSARSGVTRAVTAAQCPGQGQAPDFPPPPSGQHIREGEGGRGLLGGCSPAITSGLLLPPRPAPLARSLLAAGATGATPGLPPLPPPAGHPGPRASHFEGKRGRRGTPDRQERLPPERTLRKPRREQKKTRNPYRGAPHGPENRLHP